MLAKPLRLNLARAAWRYRSADFSISTSYFKILAKRKKGAGQFGFLVAGKLGKAAKRNQAKRYLTEAVKQNLESFPSGFDFVVIAYPGSLGATYEEIRASLDQVLPKISFLR